MDYFKLSRTIWFVGIGRLLNALALGMVLPFMAYFLSRLGWHPDLIGLLLGLATLSGIAGTVISGMIGDRVGPSRLIAFSGFGQVVAFSVLGTATTFWPLVAAGMALGLLSGMFWAPQGAIIASVATQAEQKKAFGLSYALSNVGAAVGPALGAFLVGLGRVTFFASASVSALILAVFFLALPVPRMPEEAVDDPSSGLQTLLGDKRLIRFLSGLVFWAVAYSLVQSFLVLVLGGIGYPDPTRGLALFMSENAILCVLLTPVATRVVEKMRRHEDSMMAAGVIAAVGLALASHATSPVVLIIASLLFTTGEILFMPFTGAYVAQLAPGRLRSAYMAGLSLTYALGGGLSALLGGLALQHLGGVTLFALGSLSFLTGSVVFAWIRMRAVREDLVSVQAREGASPGF